MNPEKQKNKKSSITENYQVPKPRGRIMSIFQEPMENKGRDEDPSDGLRDTEMIYGGLDASLTLLIHGIESDWIEEEMADDDDFK